MITRKSSNDSTRTYCPVSERKVLEMRRDKLILLEYIHSKILQHVRMEKLLEPCEVQKYIEEIKKLHTGQPNIEIFKKKIRTMLLTIFDSFVQFEQAVSSGEVPLYSVDVSQNFDFSQQSSGTSIAEVPSFSSIELTNMDFKTVPHNSQNSCNTDFSVGKEYTPEKFGYGLFDNKLNRVDQLCKKKIRCSQTAKTTKKCLNEDYFKKPISKKFKINGSKIDKKNHFANKENLNFSIYEIKNINSNKNRKSDTENLTLDLDQDIFSSDIEKSSIPCYNYSKADDKLNTNVDELNLHKLHEKSPNDSNSERMNCVHEHDAAKTDTTVKSTTCFINKKAIINCKDIKGDHNINYDNVIPDAQISCTYTQNEEYINMQSKSKGKKNSPDNVNYQDQIRTNNHLRNKLNCSSLVNTELTNYQTTQNTDQSFCLAISDSAISLESYISQTPEESSNEVNGTYSIEYPEDICECKRSLILYQNSFPLLLNGKNSSKSFNRTFHVKYKKHIDKKLIRASNNIITIDEELVTQPCDTELFIKESKKISDLEIGVKYETTKKLCGKIALAAEQCFNTWNKFIQALEEIETKKSLSNEDTKKKVSEHHYNAIQKICDNYNNRFRYYREVEKSDEEYVSLERNIKKWSNFQSLVLKIKEAHKRKLDVK